MPLGETKSMIAVSSRPSHFTVRFTGSVPSFVKFVDAKIVAPVPYMISSLLNGFIETSVIHQPSLSCPCQSSQGASEISSVYCVSFVPGFQRPSHVAPPSFVTSTLSTNPQRQSVETTIVCGSFASMSIPL